MNVILAIHISIAITGLIMSGLAAFRPTLNLFRLSCSAVVLTFISGAYLVVAGQGHLVSSCISGIIYLAAASAGLVPARLRLASQKQI